MKHHAQGNFLHLKTRCQRAQRRSLASVRINALNQYTQIDLLPPPSSILPKYDLDGQQKSAKGKALQQPDRDFEACARLNEHKSEERYPAKERQQSVTAYVDELGDVRAAYALDAFGQTISQGGDMASTFSHRFSTKYADDETELYYYGYRYYAPQLGRWINRDPIEEQGGVNLYGFAKNSPLNNFDLFGMSVYWDNYPNYSLYPSEETTKVWEMVGGRLFWNHITEPLRKKPDDGNTILRWLNSCALRVSIALNKAKKTIRAGEGIERNFDVKADMEISYGEKTIKKGDTVKATPPNTRYVVRANNMPDVLSKIDKLKKVPWSTKKDAKGLRKCLENQDKEAFFTGMGHVGMIKKGYEDPYFPFDEKGTIWIIEE
jgi:RHS repeat-associated protein